MIALLHIYTELEFMKIHSAHRSQDKSFNVVTGWMAGVQFLARERFSSSL
jgi:hypothetical protein